MKQGMTRAEAVDSIDRLLLAHDSHPDGRAQHKESLKTAGVWFPVLGDLKVLTLLAVEMQRQGNVFGKFKVEVYGNAPAVIINSYPGLKAHLSGTRYLASNPKLFTIGVGKLSANKAMKGGFVVSIMISVAFHFTEQLLNDDTTWHHFVAGIAVDATVAISAVLTSSLVMKGVVLVGGTAVAASSIAPLIVYVWVGVLFGFLNYFYSSKGIENALVEDLRQLEEKLQQGTLKLNNDTRTLKEELYKDPYEFLSRLFGVPFIKFGH
ncbi:hypothetical protein [Shewanella sp. Scap07]|uniref:hypothetical protein n=1 Tax=Shewanella sp. Scap07 TaxID=2589987 RepID=UPI00211754CC|nr:hypothetical protein [Shewanella sp. Scap07]